MFWKYQRKIFINVLLISIIILPISAHATTLKEYEDQVAKYTAELKEKEAKLAKNKEDVEKVKNNIKNITTKISQTENEIVNIQKEIDRSNKEIEEKNAESKRVIEYYQIENGNNAYLEYIFGAETITDMIYRMSVVEQLTDYNDKIMKELKILVEQNKKKKIELNSKKEDLKKLQSSLEEEKKKIEADSAQVEGTIPSTKGKIEFYQQRVNYYRNKGCSSNDVIGVTCDVPKKVVVTKSSTSSSRSGSSSKVDAGPVIGDNGFRFPVNGGRISQYYGNGGHKGLDITRGCGTPIYAVASGRVYYVGNNLDIYGAKMVLIVHNVNGTLVFSQYAHLQGYNVSVGQDVDNNTVIGYMGTTGYSTGCHLHLEMSEGYGWAYNTTYWTYTKHIINPFKYVPRP